MAFSNGSSTSNVSGDRVDALAATHVTLDRSAVRFIDAEQVDLDRAAVQRLRATQANVSQSAIAVASIEQGTLRQTNAGVVIARSVACDEVHVGILASPVVRGDVHTWLDLRSAVAIGVGMVLGKAAIAGVRALGRRATR
jgi:hypothetical protein